MNSLEANIRENNTKGELNTIRKNGNVPAIVYGGKNQNQQIQTTYSIDNNQVFKVVVKHIETGTELITEQLSYKEGTLSGKSHQPDDLDEFEVS